MSALETLDTFLSNAYNYEHFKKFIIESFGEDIGIKTERHIPYNHNNSIIISYSQICENIHLDSQELGIYAFKTQSINAKITLHKEIAKILENQLSINAILAVFYDESAEFRLSLVTKGFDFAQNKTTFSNLRRSSFTLGKNAKIKTAKNQLETFLNEKDKKLGHLQDAFSVEPVTKEFYKQIKNIFDKLCIQIKAQSLNMQQKKEFAIKLLGRILFIYFLKKLEIVPKEIFILCENYYNEILVPLFFEVLNSKQEKRKEHIKTHHLFTQVPFLNGGLFAPSSVDCYTDTPLGGTSHIFIPDDIFEELFAILQAYHFTIDESTPDNQEIGLDPEMLGRVFENLLTEIDPNLDDTITARKATGSFYTPRNIVSFMCKNALLEALKAKLPKNLSIKANNIILSRENSQLTPQEKEQILFVLNNLKILDMFCGSGAFPMGILHEIIAIQEILDDKRSIYERKLAIIESQIYGVDIQNIATEISRLRCFLSLIIESQIDKNKVNSNIPPLPNLEFKFACANSFLKFPSGMDYDGYQADKEKLKCIRQQTFSPKADKNQLKNDFKKIKDKIYDNLLVFKGEDSCRILSYDPFDETNVADFFDAELMFGVKTFDICISNPPYISTKGKAHQKIKSALLAQDGFFDDSYNHAFFICYHYLADKGILSLITPKTFWTIETKLNLRKLILKNALHFICDSANPFYAAMVDTCITQLGKDTSYQDNFLFVDGSQDFTNPILYEFSQEQYSKTANQIIFKPTPINLTIYDKYNAIVKTLMQHWWGKIKTSKDISKNYIALESYRNTLKPGDVTLLGLITDGGQGLATGNNGKYIALKLGSKEAKRCREQRAEKLYRKREVQEDLGIVLKNKKEALNYLESISEGEIWDIFARAKIKYGRDIWGQGFLYKVIDETFIADVQTLTDDEKQNGIDSTRCYVPYDKGDKDGNRWYLPTPYYIAWSKENVRFLKTHSGKKGEGSL